MCVDFQEGSDEGLNHICSFIFVYEQVSWSQQMHVLRLKYLYWKSYYLACYFLQGYRKWEAWAQRFLQKIWMGP